MLDAYYLIMESNSVLKKYGYLWLTLVLFLGSAIGHWVFAWNAFKDEQKSHNQPAVINTFAIETARDTLENWQSEFLQLMWQVSGLAILWHVGSPQSKEGDDRKEEKLDEILRKVNPRKAEKIIKSLDIKYPKK